MYLTKPPIKHTPNTALDFSHSALTTAGDLHVEEARHQLCNPLETIRDNVALNRHNQVHLWEINGSSRPSVEEERLRRDPCTHRMDAIPKNIFFSLSLCFSAEHARTSEDRKGRTRADGPLVNRLRMTSSSQTDKTKKMKGKNVKTGHQIYLGGR